MICLGIRLRPLGRFILLVGSTQLPLFSKDTWYEHDKFGRQYSLRARCWSFWTLFTGGNLITNRLRSTVRLFTIVGATALLGGSKCLTRTVTTGIETN